MLAAHPQTVDGLVLTANLKAAFKAAGSGRRLEPNTSGTKQLFVDLEISENLTYLPAALVSHFFRGFGIDDLINDHVVQPPRAASTATVLEALVAHRCVEPGSKLAFQGWIKRVATNEVHIPMNAVTDSDEGGHFGVKG